jgi:hypothetical protein
MTGEHYTCEHETLFKAGENEEQDEESDSEDEVPVPQKKRTKPLRTQMVDSDEEANEVCSLPWT